MGCSSFDSGDLGELEQGMLLQARLTRNWSRRGCEYGRYNSDEEKRFELHLTDWDQAARLEVWAIS